MVQERNTFSIKINNIPEYTRKGVSFPLPKQSPTSSVFVAQIRKAPDVAESHTVADAGQQELGRR